MNQRESIVSAVVVIVVAAVGAFGMKVDANALTDVISAAALIAAYAWGIWKNHNFTDAAAEMQAQLNIAKATVPRNVFGIEDEEAL